MTTPDDSAISEPLVRHEQLFAPFAAAFASPGLRIGLEAEKFGLRSNGSPLRYGDPDGVPAIFAELCARFGWQPQGEVPGGPVLSVVRKDASITLEPGSQFELSGAPWDTVHEVYAEVRTHMRELAALESARDYQWLGLGFHPFARPDELDWVPKLRYPVMREYFPARGRHGLDMMQRTATVQANFDVRSERDAMRKLRVALSLSPIVQAIFLNSSVYERARHPVKSHRAEVWLDVDGQRSGLLPFAWSPDAVIGDYVQWALDVPMFLFKRDGRVVANTGQTFADFMAHGFEGHHATTSDWEMHLGTLFPEVRLKRTLEVRSADSVPSKTSMALPALWTGILYDSDVLDEALTVALPFGHDAWARARSELAKRGLATRVEGATVQSLAARVIELASRGLARRCRRDPNGHDERMYLETIAELVDRGMSVGDAVLGDWNESAPDAIAQLVERARY